MKTYPSIPRKFRGIPNAYVFDKLDGSNIRVEWSKKRGFFKFGRRNGLLDDSHPILAAEVPPTFAKIADRYARLCEEYRWQTCVLFFEFWGEQSFAGKHVAGDPKRMTLIDAAPNKKGILPPQDFLGTFSPAGVEIAKFIGHLEWTRGLIERVRKGLSKTTGRLGTGLARALTGKLHLDAATVADCLSGPA